MHDNLTEAYEEVGSVEELLGIRGEEENGEASEDDETPVIREAEP